ncbi:hypothetical protein [Luteococcus sp. OSA5]|uniref:hypothetical protein n=1 Tax=Luteococcus sp. OSA5 TaxID=3401630 RepID=UPI003B43244A
MEIIESLIPYADLAVAAYIALSLFGEFLSARSERERRRRLRAEGYCAHPTHSKKDYCHNPPARPGGRCRANHPSALPVPVINRRSFVWAAAGISIFLIVRPIAEYLWPLANR